MALSPDQQVTVVVAIVGGLVTVAGLLLSPWAHGRADRRNHMQSLRVDAYSDLLVIVRRFHDNAQTWSAIPLADLEEPPRERIDATIARIRVVGSPEVYKAANDFGSLAAAFNAKLFAAKVTHQPDDSPKQLMARMDLGTIADKITVSVEGLEATIRTEMQD